MAPKDPEGHVKQRKEKTHFVRQPKSCQTLSAPASRSLGVLQVTGSLQVSELAWQGPGDAA